MRIAFVIAIGLIFPGIIGVTKAKLSGRKGPTLFQPIWDVLRLFRKGSIYSFSSSQILQISTVVYYVSILVALFYIPVGRYPVLFSFEGDFVFFAYLLAIGKFLLILGAMDIGSGFEGMGANREALYSMLIEPAFFILIGSMAMFTQHISFYDIYLNIELGAYLPTLIILVGSFLLIQIAVIENSRIPVDDPKTHLELTMVHEVMILDHSGFDLALIHLANGLKFALYGLLIANFFVPDIPVVLQYGVILFIQIVFAITIGIQESFRARNKLAKNPQWILTMTAISLIVFMAALIAENKIM